MISKKRKERNSVAIGNIIKEKRISEGYSQKGLADALGIEYYTMISQIELGYMAVPPSLWVPLEDKLRFEPAELSILCLSEYQPNIFAALFGNASRDEIIVLLSRLRKGQITGPE